MCVTFDLLFKVKHSHFICSQSISNHLDAKSIKGNTLYVISAFVQNAIKKGSKTFDIYSNSIKLMAAFCILCLFRIKIMSCSLPKFSRYDNPLPTLATPNRQLSMLLIWLLNVKQLIYPATLSCDWSASSIPIVSSLSDIFYIGVEPLTAFTFCLLLLKHLKNKTILFMVAISILSFLPASNLLFWVGFVLAERVLYLPSIGFCFVVAYFTLNSRQTAFKNFKWIHSLGCFLLLFGLSTKTIFRTHQCVLQCAQETCLAVKQPQQNEHTLFSADLKVHPNNVKLLNNLGKLEESAGNYETALKLYSKAMQAVPGDVRGWLNSANLNTKLGNYQVAEHFYRRAIASFPTLIQSVNAKREDLGKSSVRSAANINPSTMVGSVTAMQLRAAINLANLMSHNPIKSNEAAQLYERLIAIKPDFGATYLHWIHNLLAHNSSDRHSVQNVLFRLLSNAPHLDCDLLYNVAVLLSNSGDSLMALQVFDQILKLNPSHEESLITSARIIRKNSEFNKLHGVAIERLEKIVLLNKFDHTIFFELGMLYINFNIDKSITYLHKAIQLKPHFSEALFNLSLLLYKLNRSTEALPFLELLLKYDESHQKAMILLIAINSSLGEEIKQFQFKHILDDQTKLKI